MCIRDRRKDEQRGEYLYFKVSEILQIQNLLENMIYSLVMKMCIRDSRLH